MDEMEAAECGGLVDSRGSEQISGVGKKVIWTKKAKDVRQDERDRRA